MKIPNKNKKTNKYQRIKISKVFLKFLTKYMIRLNNYKKKLMNPKNKIRTKKNLKIRNQKYQFYLMHLKTLTKSKRN